MAGKSLCTKRLIVKVAIAAAVLSLWLWRWPHLMVAREQMQLFLCNGDYLWQRVTEPGGTAKYVSELMVQFFLHPVNGACCLTFLFVLVQWLTSRLLSARLYWLSYVPAVVLCWLWTDLQIPLSLTVAVVLVLMVLNVLRRRKPVPATLSAVVLLPLTYWMAGPSPEDDTYYWQRRQVGSHEEMAYDLQLRRQQWGKIVTMYRQQPSDQLAIRNAALLAQWNQRLISEQDLLQGLSLSNRTLRGVSSAFIMSEVALQIGMVSISQRAAFEAMEAIPNGNKSGRALRRLVETNIVTGQYEVALKYINILEETLFYREWARTMRPLAEHPETITDHPYYHKLQEVYNNGHDTFFY